MEAEFNESVDEDEDESARLLHDLLLLRLFEAQPSRSKEVRLLEFIDWASLKLLRGKLSAGEFSERTKRNFFTQRPMGPFVSYVSDYKTVKFYGCDEVSHYSFFCQCNGSS